MAELKTLNAAGMDAGSAFTRCVILQLEGDLVRFRGHGEVPSRGWKKGRIADLSAVSESMLAALRAAESAAALSVESTVAGVGATVRGANCRGFHDLGRTRAVEQKDVNHAINRATKVVLPDDRMILQVFPQDFVVDGHPGHRDPRQMIAGQIEANVHIATASLGEHSKLVAAVNRAHLEVEETVCEGLAACYAAVRPEQRREGYAVINIGAQSSELVVFNGEAAQLACSLPLSGDHFTHDLAGVLCISLEDANTIKHEFGCARADSAARNVWVEAPSRDRDVPSHTLNRILEARAVELFQYVQRELQRIGMQGALIGGVYLAGAAARLDGICEVAEEILHSSARIALPIDILDWPEEIYDPAWTTVAGLALYSAKLKSKRESQRRSFGLLGRALQ